jgi:trk system potassium uptake protein
MYVLIVGGGKVGTQLADLLIEQGHRIKVIENQPEHFAKLKGRFPLDAIVEGSGTDPVLLESAGIRQAAVVAAVTGNDETNLVVTELARFEFQAPHTVARVNNPKNAWLFTPGMGVDIAVDQASLISHLVIAEISLGEMITLLKLRKGDYELVEECIDKTAPAAYHPISDLPLPPGSAISALLRQGQLIIPQASTVLLPEDEVVAVVTSANAPKLAALLGPK